MTRHLVFVFTLSDNTKESDALEVGGRLIADGILHAQIDDHEYRHLGGIGIESATCYVAKETADYEPTREDDKP